MIRFLRKFTFVSTNVETDYMFILKRHNQTSPTQRQISLLTKRHFICICDGFCLQNQIEIIENLESLRGLQFLTLAANRIRRIEGLTRLPKLGFLDLSENLIETFDIGLFFGAIF